MRWIVPVLAACGPPPVPPAPPQPHPIAMIDAGIDAPPPDLALVHESPVEPGVPAFHLVQTGAVLQRMPAVDPGVLAFDATGDRLAAIADGTLVVLDVSAGDVRARVRPVDDRANLAFSPDGARIAVSAADATTVVDLAHATVGAPIACTHGTAAWAPDGALVLACEDAVRVWDATERFAVTRSEAAPIPAAHLISPDGTRLAIADGPTLAVRALDDGRLLASESTWPVVDVSWRPDGQAIATAERDTVRIVDAGALAELASRDADTNSIAFSPDGMSLAIAGTRPVAWTPQTGEVAPLDLGPATRVHWFAPGVIGVDNADLDGAADNHGHHLGAFCQGGCGDISVAWSRDGVRAAVRDTGAIVVYDSATSSVVARFDRQLARERPVFSDDGTLLLLPYAQRAIDLAAGKVAMLPRRSAALLSGDGARAFAERDKGWVTIDARSGRTLAASPRQPAHLRELSVSGDGAFLYRVDEDRLKHLALHVWPATGGEMRTIALPAGARDAIAIPRSPRVFSRDARVMVDLASGRSRKIAGTGRTTFAASADGTRVVVDHTVYDAASLAQLDTFDGDARALTPHGDAVVIDDTLHAIGGVTVPFHAPDDLVWSPDGNLVLAGATLWDAKADAPVIAFDRPMHFVGNHCLADYTSSLRIVRPSGEWLEVAVVADGPTGLVAIGSDGVVEGSVASLAAIAGGTQVVTTGAYKSIAAFVAACR